MHNCCVWGSEGPNDVEDERDSLEIMKNKVIVLFFFEQPTITGDDFLLCIMLL
jgi:hypothetical protein